VFFARTELLALAVVDSLVVVGQKRDWDKTRSSSVAVRDSCSRPIRACLVEQFPHLLIGNWFLMDYAGNYACFPAAFYKCICSNNLFAWSEIMENGLLCGGVRRKWSTGGFNGFNQWTFAIRVIFLPRRRVKTLQLNIQFFFWHFLYRFRKFGATRTSKPFCSGKICFCYIIFMNA